ncbi:nucleotide exchange factor GrpE [Parenemella sanctibonifatiensis]|uniref:Protein GrpE n=1 Tax=Parenemella sanctibonifatiensis TaxID=2016505 RepID=A0A255EB90_9ACTN|nr:nucleotide exchange factor GrpE [Parenemella sanctibonifatiensis]OYN88796.1 nucleotide exchange factor GrpE [Parenemella sanctibonifatiensis]
MTPGDQHHRDDGSEETEPTGPVIRDRRRLDPETYQVRQPESGPDRNGPGQAPATGDNVTDAQQPQDPIEPTESTPDVDPDQSVGSSDAPAGADGVQQMIDELQSELNDRTDDLKRVQAEYVNYKRRVDRDRAQSKQQGIQAVATDLIPVLDAVRAAAEVGDLDGGAKLIGEELGRVAAKYGLVQYGEVGDEFDPHLHEALFQMEMPGVTVPTCAQIIQVGVRLGDRVIRPARVGVAEPDPAAQQPGDGADATN